MFFKRTKRKNRKIKKIFFLFFGLIFFLLAIVVIVFHKKSSIVSPVPNSFLLKSLKNVSTSDLRMFDKTKSIEESLKKSDIPFSKVMVSTGSSYIVFLSEGGEVIISPNKDLSFQISSLQLVLSRFTIEGKKFRSLDFRYDRPVVTLR